MIFWNRKACGAHQPIHDQHPQLLADLTRRLTLLKADRRARIDTEPELKARQQGEWQAARDAERTAETFESWADQVITQAGVPWLSNCVFLRFIEHNGSVDRPWSGGTPDSGGAGQPDERQTQHGQARRIVAAVFELVESFDQDRDDVSRDDCRDDATDELLISNFRHFRLRSRRTPGLNRPATWRKIVPMPDTLQPPTPPHETRR